MAFHPQSLASFLGDGGLNLFKFLEILKAASILAPPPPMFQMGTGFVNIPCIKAISLAVGGRPKN